ncbi:hypothetical protein ONE63_007550 [Megalurothrips usitatus]|uniref:C2H2-type domain-containing protein n=1 Tax=Megalurothrips usitatus TaxID=439358 RepID=A0AAV7XN34_9NEOP|nr:hypothetical protein ONE63_007550 [Megalurothrips usitatus]
MQYRSHLIRHLRKVHDGEGIEECETCGKSFSFKGSLKAHQLLHTGVKSFLCKFCGKAFHQKGEMKRHERKHTGEKPFICEVCGRAFAYRESLLGHSAVHTGVKPFPCKACGMRFSCSGNLVKHRRSNNCKGFMEPGMEGVGIENPEGNANVNQPVSAIPDNSTKPDCLHSDTHTMLNEIQTSSNKVVDQCLEGAQSTVTQAHNPSPNQGAVVSNSSVTSSALSITPMSAPGNASDVPMLVSRNVSSIPRAASHVPMSEPRSINNVQMPVNSSSMSAPMNNLASPDRHSVSVPPMATASVIKSAPSINVKPTSALQGMPKESRPSAHIETPQSHGVTISASNRPSGHMNNMYNSHENGVTVQSNYGSQISNASYNDNQIRQSTQVNPNDRRFMQFSMDGYTGRPDQYFDRQALMRHEMSRQAMERSTDRSASRFLDWTGGMQFSGMDSRNSLQSYPSAQIPHNTGYPNLHSGHFGNYAASHTTGHSNNHANVYGGNTMMPGGVGFSAFAANNPIGMGYAPNNTIAAHSVAHSSSYPASHMSHLEALFGHFSHAGSNNSFPRLSSHNAGSPANPSLPSNNRV